MNCHAFDGGPCAWSLKNLVPGNNSSLQWTEMDRDNEGSISQHLLTVLTFPVTGEFSVLWPPTSWFQGSLIGKILYSYRFQHASKNSNRSWGMDLSHRILIFAAEGLRARQLPRQSKALLPRSTGKKVTEKDVMSWYMGPPNYAVYCYYYCYYKLVALGSTRLEKHNRNIYIYVYVYICNG